MESMSIRELLELDGDNADGLLNCSLGYTEASGAPQLREVEKFNLDLILIRYNLADPTYDTNRVLPELSAPSPC